jgi:hypothetical protein
MSREHRIRELAYQLWVARGCPEGNSDQDWLEAESQLSVAQPTEASSTRGIDDALKDTYPASDPPASHFPDEPPANAEAKWAAAATAKNSKRRTNSVRGTTDGTDRSKPKVTPRPRPSGQ